jgi:hypothetical protein
MVGQTNINYCPECQRMRGGMAIQITRSLDQVVIDENARLLAENKTLKAEVFRLRNQQRRR